MNRSTTPFALGCAAVLTIACAESSGVAVHGTVSDADGRPVAAASVTARSNELRRSVTVYTDERGEYQFSALPPTRYRIEARRLGYSTERTEIEYESGAADLGLEFELSKSTALADDAPSSMFLSILPDGEVKRQFILDCTGCHQFNLKIVEKDGHPKSREDWVARTEQMLTFAGAKTPFPIMSPGRAAEATADWLMASLGGPEDPLPHLTAPAHLASESADAVITEYDLPNPDLPHDVMVVPDGQILVTGMFTHQMYVLDPDSGTFSQLPIPVTNANPRALDIAEDGKWWVLLGVPLQMASFDPSTDEWQTYDLGMYPHSVMLDERGRVWYNGHFTVDPELFGVLDPETGEATTYEVPELVMPEGVSTIPYGLRVAPDGTVWGTELAGSRLISFDPDEEEFNVYTLPTTHSGPRRLDIGPDGIVWVPEYSNNRLARFDPGGAEFKEYEIPIPDALPYVARVDMRRGTVWVGTAGADAIVRFDPISEQFTVYRLPTRGALIRHIDVDEETGAVWGAYSPAPVLAPKVFKVELLNNSGVR